MKKIFVALLVILVAGLFFFPKKGEINQIKKPTVNFTPTPTSIPFQEITIPFLRERGYDSNLKQLSLYSDNQNFTTYLTSYTSDGLKINGLLTKPKEEMPLGGYPAVVFVHGYIAPTIYKTTEKYTDYVNYLARNGFVVFKIDLRGHGESEGEAGGSYYSGDYVIDTLNAYSALQNSDFVNPNKIGLWGHSMAGNITFRSLVIKKDIPVVIWAGAGYSYSDLSDYQISDNSYRTPPQDTERARRRRILNETYGSFDPNHEFWKLVPGTNYLDGVKGALEIHHAIDDGVVGIEYSRNLMSILDKTNIPHTLYEYPTGGHNISGQSFSQAMMRTVDFFKENLK